MFPDELIEALLSKLSGLYYKVAAGYETVEPGGVNIIWDNANSVEVIPSNTGYIYSYSLRFRLWPSPVESYADYIRSSRERAKEILRCFNDEDIKKYVRVIRFNYSPTAVQGADGQEGMVIDLTVEVQAVVRFS